MDSSSRLFCVASNCSLRAPNFPRLEHRDLVCELIDAGLAPHELAILHLHLALGVRDLRQALRNLGLLAGDERIAIVDLLQEPLRQFSFRTLFLEGNPVLRSLSAIFKAMGLRLVGQPLASRITSASAG